MKVLQASILICLVLASLTTTPVSGNDAPRIARWYQNYGGAVSLRFDDSLESHVTTAIPLLNQYGFKATFMVNPGTKRYRAHQDFWERQVPAMGHRLGDHTMNHNGARDLGEADYEIGEAARVIWRISPQESKLLVFASGGGKRWGGREWEQADPSYRRIVEKYHLIDLYDGKHPQLSVNAKLGTKELCDRLIRTVDDHSHLSFAFHDIGRPSFMDSVKAMIHGYDLVTSDETFSGFLECLAEWRNRLWVAPLIDILKYEEEASGATVKVLTSTRRSCILKLAIRTDPSLYDHKLTMIFPAEQGMAVTAVTQDNETRHAYQRIPGEFLVDVKPVNSTITVYFNSI